MMNNNEIERQLALIAEYKKCVGVFCYYLALLSMVTTQAESGKTPDDKKLRMLLENLALAKEAFLVAREDLGLKKEAKFISPGEDYHFAAGFSLKDGRLTGTVPSSTVQHTALLWMQPFPKSLSPSEDECVRYEVATLCVMLSGSCQRIFEAACGVNKEQTVLSGLWKKLHLLYKKVEPKLGGI